MISWWKNLPSPTRGALLLFLLIIGVSLVLWGLSSRFQPQKSASVSTPNGDTIAFSVDDHLSGISVGTLNNQAFQKVLEAFEYGVLWTDFYDPTTSQLIQPKEFIFAFRELSDISESEQQQLLDATFQQNELIKGINTTYDAQSRVFIYNIYFSPSIISSLSESELKQALHGNLIRGLYLSSAINAQELGDRDFADYARTVTEKLKESDLNLFEISLSQSHWQSFAALIVSQAHAQGQCTGGYNCQNRTWSNCTCNLGGGSCFGGQGSDCGPDNLGTCQCEPGCSGSTGRFCQGGDEVSCLASGSNCSGDQFCPGSAHNRQCAWIPDQGSGQTCPGTQHWCGGCYQGCLNANESCIAAQESCSPGGNPGPGPTPATCPAGQRVCGGCINDCRPTSQSCDQWIDLECGGGPPPPACHDANCGTICEGNPGICGSTTPCEGMQDTAMCWSGGCCTPGDEPLYRCNNSQVQVNSPPCDHMGNWEIQLNNFDNADDVAVRIVKEGIPGDVWRYENATKHDLGSNNYRFTFNIGQLLQNLRNNVNLNNYPNIEPDGKGSFRVEVSIFRSGNQGGWRHNRCSGNFYVSPAVDLMPPSCNRNTGTFTWSTVENVSNYLFRTNYDDSVDGGWFSGYQNYPPNGNDSRWDHERKVPSVGNAGMGSCIGPLCELVLNNSTLNNGKEWIAGEYEGYSVTVTDPYSADPWAPSSQLCTSNYPAFSCGQQKRCTVNIPQNSYGRGEPIPVSMNAFHEPHLAPGSNSRTVELFVAKTDRTRMATRPNGTTEVQGAGGTYYYRYPGCLTAQDTGWCNVNISPTDLPDGNYDFFCQMPGDIDQCSGNPRCDASLGGDPNLCPDWVSCGVEDSDRVSVSCTPTCSVRCGQDDGCGGTCGNQDGQQPGINLNITSPTPVNGIADMTGDDGSLRIGWNDPSNRATAYNLKIYPNGAYSSPENAPCSATNVFCLTGTTNAFHNYNPNTAIGNRIGDRMRIAVQATNTNCSAYGNTQNSLWTSRRVDLTGRVEYRIYETSAHNSCSSIDSANLSGTNTEISARTDRYLGNQRQNVNDGDDIQLRYLQSQWGTYQLDLHLDNPDPANSLICATSCNGNNDPEICTPYPGSNDYHAPYPFSAAFYVTRENLSNNPWFQWANGNAFAGGNLRSPVASTCAGNPNCTNFVSLTSDSSNKSYAGIPITESDSIQTGNGGYSQRRQPPAPQAAGRYAMSQEFNTDNRRDFDYYLSTLSAGTPSFDNQNQINQYSNISDNPNEVLYYRPSSGTLTINAGPSANRWSVGADTQKVILVDGHVRILGQANQRVITVNENGGFLAIIASGDITFENSVGYAVSDASPPESRNQTDQANVEGVFIGNKIIINDDGNGSESDNKFLGAGTFVGWEAIELRRSFGNNPDPDEADFGNRFHNNSPTELFFYRPDFVLNAPRAMQETNLIWQERVE